MRYSNPRITRPDPEQVSKGENQEFLRLLVTVTLIVIVCMVAADRLAAWAAPSLPFSMETRLAQTMKLDSFNEAMGHLSTTSKNHQEIEAALQAHADKIVKALRVPSDISIHVHYNESPVVNAYATLGGHITFYKGLLSKLKYEEELDAVLAHEIGHVTHRHMVKHLSRGIMTATALSVVGVRSKGLTQWLIGDAQQLQQLAYSRSAEREADSTALAASRALYGSSYGVVHLFEAFEQIQREQEHLQVPVPWLQSHPLPVERARAAKEDSLAGVRPLTPLSAPLQLAAGQ